MSPVPLLLALRGRLQRFSLAPTDLLRDPVYRRLWTSILISSLGGQITLLAIPLTAAALLDASPTQMGWLTAMETVPFALFSLPAGVWLDRVRKLPVYIYGELMLAVVVGTVPLAWWRGWLSMPWLYLVAFLIGFIYTTAGSAAQIVLTQIVARDRLVEAHAKNALASSAAEVAGPGAAGALIKLTGAPLALLADVFLLVVSAGILRGIRVREGPRHKRTHFWRSMRAGLDFVGSHRLLVTMAMTVGTFQLCNQGALVVQILVATRLLGLSEHEVGLCYVALGVGTICASTVGHAVARRIGPGPALVLGIAICALGWLLLAAAPTGRLGVVAFTVMLACFGVGAVFIFINFLALRQAVTPTPLLGRMTSTMRWLILLPGIPGALIGGWLGEHVGLQAALGFSGGVGLLLALVAIRQPILRQTLVLPVAEREGRAMLGPPASPG
ncbi:Arabinose efflux permease family protein [Burkholderiales bacterium]|nr:Arabinose efflux permease family protein [Burkholderiales bacterium]